MPLTNIEECIFHFLNKAGFNAIVDYVMILFTDLADSKFLFALAIGLLFFKNRRIKFLGLFLLAGLTLTHYIVDTLKELVARPRPFLALENVNIIFPRGEFSFPSGHATRAFLTASIMSSVFRRRYLIYILAVISALSRVYLGVHFPLDILVGACIGIMVGYFLVYIAGRNGIKEYCQKS